MRISAAWLLIIFLVVVTANTSPTSPPSFSSTTKFLILNNGVNTTNAASVKAEKSKIPDYVRPFANTKDILMQEIHTLDKDTNDVKIQKEVADTLKAEAQKDRWNLRMKSNKGTTEKVQVTERENLKKFADKPSKTDYDEEDDEEDDDYEYDDVADDLMDSLQEGVTDELVDDDEEVMTKCPEYCRCVGQYAAAMTATCTKLVDGQSFGPSTAHLRIENAGEIRLGPNALQTRGLQYLESITITDTRIVELDRTAFNGITYLFAVNLTRNDLQDIHPNTFQNNSQLSLLAIAGNQLKHIQDSKSTRHYLLHASSVTDLDISNNGITKLKRSAFSKMQSLNYVNLSGNKLKEIDSKIFDSQDSLMEVDLSNNSLDDLPLDLFFETYVQALRIAGNNLSTLATIRALQLTTLDVSRNKIRQIAKEDLDSVPLLEQLYIKSNGLKRIHQHAFNNLKELSYLDLSDNKLTTLTEHHFRNNPNLQVLLLSDNPALHTLPVFRTYSSEYNVFSVFRFECANCGLDSIQAGTFDSMPTLSRLNLAKNRLTGLPVGLMDHLESLRELDLSNNFISALEPEIFRGAKSLGTLILANNPLRTLQVTPFLNAPELTKLDVSRCNLERVWSEARVPLKNLRFLSVGANLLRRITVEELRATPILTTLNLSHNPLDCDSEFTEALQWLTDHGVSPVESLRYINDFPDDDEKTDSKGISQWTDLAKIVCDGIEDGPPAREFPGKSAQPKDDPLEIEIPEDSDSLLRNELDKNVKLLQLDIDHGMRLADEPRLLENEEYDDEFAVTTEYHSWYNLRPGFKIWLISGTVLSALVIFLLIARIACCLANKQGRGPVLRPPMILRQGLVDNKNCGLVYKPLQEEVATPHMPKRGSFYSSSTFHYDKIVPESV